MLTLRLFFFANKMSPGMEVTIIHSYLKLSFGKIV
jgi:hypothetical protein